MVSSFNWLARPDSFEMRDGLLRELGGLPRRWYCGRSPEIRAARIIVVTDARGVLSGYGWSLATRIEREHQRTSPSRADGRRPTSPRSPVEGLFD